ncbi:uncharacterized protein [Ranitomeya imitator]|uniref:uncharacterized protein n=1 Tax=Ranitomeya imitator TaxID=111125 RepID=UPI001AAB0FEB
MKNIAIFLLVGLGLFSSGYSIDVNDVAGLGIDINDCLNALFQKGPELLTSLAGIACKKPDQSDIEKVKKSVQATTDFLIKANCLPGDLVGLDVQNVADDVLDEVNKMYLSIVSDHLEPLKVVMPTVCTLLSPALTSNCVHELLQTVGHLTDKLGIKLLSGLKCQNTDPNSINLETVKKVWSKLECGLGQALDIKGLELVTGPAKSVVNNVVSKTVNEILNNKQLESVMTGVTCLVNNVLGVVKL